MNPEALLDMLLDAADAKREKERSTVTAQAFGTELGKLDAKVGKLEDRLHMLERVLEQSIRAQEDDLLARAYASRPSPPPEGGFPSARGVSEHERPGLRLVPGYEITPGDVYLWGSEDTFFLVRMTAALSDTLWEAWMLETNGREIGRVWVRTENLHHANDYYTEKFQRCAAEVTR
jgi:hypothetical protein